MGVNRHIGRGLLRTARGYALQQETIMDAAMAPQAPDRQKTGARTLRSWPVSPLCSAQPRWPDKAQRYMTRTVGPGSPRVRRQALSGLRIIASTCRDISPDVASIA